jgi:hypothetical protein
MEFTLPYWQNTRRGNRIWTVTQKDSFKQLQANYEIFKLPERREILRSVEKITESKICALDLQQQR